MSKLIEYIVKWLPIGVQAYLEARKAIKDAKSNPSVPPSSSVVEPKGPETPA